MDRLSIKCKKCGRVLLVTPKYKTRRCAACNTVNRIDRSNILSEGDWKDTLKSVSDSTAPANGYETGSVRIVKRRAKRPIE